MDLSKLVYVFLALCQTSQSWTRFQSLLSLLLSKLKLLNETTDSIVPWVPGAFDNDSVLKNLYSFKLSNYTARTSLVSYNKFQNDELSRKSKNVNEISNYWQSTILGQSYSLRASKEHNVVNVMIDSIKQNSELQQIWSRKSFRATNCPDKHAICNTLNWKG